MLEDESPGIGNSHSLEKMRCAATLTSWRMFVLVHHGQVGLTGGKSELDMLNQFGRCFFRFSAERWDMGDCF
jgi:hypothetical protein